MNHLNTEHNASDRPHYDVRFDENGHLHVKNFSAWWIPELSLEREIGGTVYSVSGSFEGRENLIRKLERIAAKKFTTAEEVANDNDE